MFCRHALPAFVDRASRPESAVYFISRCLIDSLMTFSFALTLSCLHRARRPGYERQLRAQQQNSIRRLESLR
jgi:hypothetical protein